MEASGFQGSKTAPARILIVEDEAIVALDLATTLEGLGYAVAGNVPSGEAAIEQTLTMRPDLVLMEIHLEGTIGGAQAAHEIHKRDNIPIIYLSAHSHSDDSILIQARDAEPSGYLVKPFRAPELRCAIEMALHKRQLEGRLRESEERYRNLVESSIALIYTHDLHGNLLFINQAASGALGYSNQERLGRNIEEMLSPMARPGFVDYLLKIQEEQAATGKLHLLDKAGRERVWFFSNRLIQNANGDRYVLGHAQDITQMIEMQRAFRDVHQAALETEKRLSRTDSLTGLANRRAFYETAEIERKRCSRYAKPFAIVCIDVDDFQRLNDEKGHAAGDRVLACVAEVLHKKTRAECLAARLGGDKFALLLPEAGPVEVEHAVRNLHSWLRAAMQANNWPITFSLGAVTFVAPPENVEQMLQMADDAMYALKQDGKNGIATVVAA